MIGKLGANIKTAIRNPALLPLYAKWISSAGAGRQRVMRLDGIKIAGFPSFSSYLGAWRNRPTPAERAYIDACVGHGATVFDVGANYGIMAMTMGRICGPSGKVFAFEPIPETFYALTRNVVRNGFEWIHCIESAVGAAPGTVGFTNSSDPATNRMSDDSDLVVVIDTLDEICARQGIDQIDFLKIDVEGAEPDVLAGAKVLLERQAVRAGIIEICPGTLRRFGKAPELLYDALAQYGYTLSWIEEPAVPLTHDTLRDLPANFLGNAAFRPSLRANCT